jgi:hypothetical protein
MNSRNCFETRKGSTDPKIAAMDRNLSMLAATLIERIRDFPPDALRELFVALDAIERKFDLLPTLDDTQRRAIEQGLKSLERGEGVPMEDVALFKSLAGYDRDAAGKEDFADAIERVKKLSGQEQGDIAGVILALLNEHRFDISPHSPR